MQETVKQKYDSFFKTEHFKDDLKQKTLRGGVNTFGAEFFSFGFRIVSNIILARLLLPEHFGLIAMVTALTSIAERFKDLGLSSATVQRKVISHEEVSTLFWINLGFGIIFMLLVASLSPLIAKFYSDKRLIGITLALSSGFVFGGLTVQHQALLRRQMYFGRLAAIQIISDLSSLTLAIILALKGFGYWALVVKEVMRSLMISIGTLSMCPWLPGKPQWTGSVFSMLRFGGHISGFNITYFLSRSLDQILLGKFWGAGPLGFYKQAYQLMLVPISQLQFPVDRVAEPALSVLQSEPERYRQTYARIVSFLSIASMPLAVYLGIFSDNIIRLLFENIPR